jgi:hypothetical protein
MNKPRPNAWWHQHKANLGAFLIILLVFVLMFRRALFAGEFLLWGDPICYSLPLRTLAWGMIRQGQLPLWTPHLFAGYPLLSMAVIAIGYPLTWGYLFLPGYWAEQIYILAPYLLAPTFTYAYCREIKLSHLASVLAGLSFGYGGLMFSPIGLNGMLPNAVMWLPLMLIAIERAEKQKFLRCLLLSTFAYTMSVLTGIGQGFVYIGVIAFFYAVFYSLFLPSLKVTENDFSNYRKILYRLQPVGIVVSSALLAAGVAAFQILETSHAARYSVRRTLSYENFTNGSFTLWAIVKGWLEPIYPPGDVTSWTSTLTMLLALFTTINFFSSKSRNWRTGFWILIAISGFIFMLGDNTPVYRLLYHIPFVNRFRVPSRHAFEWTFALSLLAGYGWDLMSKLVSSHRSVSLRSQKIISLVLLALSSATAFLWWRKSLLLTPVYDGRLHFAYLAGKFFLTLLITLLLWQGLQIGNVRWRNVLLSGGIILILIIEPLIQLSKSSPLLAFTAQQAQHLSASGQFLRQLPPEQNRVYHFSDWTAEAEARTAEIDWLNRPAMFGIQSVAGYEPLMFERFSVALGNGDWNQVSASPYLSPERSVLSSNSRVLDLLNVTHILTYKFLRVFPASFTQTQGINFFPEDDSLEMKAEAISISCETTLEGDELVLVTSMANAPHLEDKTPVISISVHTEKGEVIERDLRAGVDTAEWAHDRPDVRQKVRHQRAPVFESFPGDDRNSFSGYRYWTRVNLGKKVRIQSLVMRRMVSSVSLGLWKAAIYDSTSGNSAPLSLNISEKLAPVRQQGNAAIYRNVQALPRVWLVAEAEAVNGVQALRAVRGESSKPFDPRRIALIETAPDQLPPLPGGDVSPQSSVRMVNYEPNRLVTETSSDKAALLVVSETFYPEWEATVDGKPSRIYTTDFLIRSVYLPAGSHRVEMKYTARHAFRGAIISIISILVTAFLAIKAWRKSKFPARLSEEITQTQ